MKRNKEIKGISISTVNYLETSRGLAFTAPILMDGKKAGMIENKGNGGMTFVFFSDKEVRAEIHKRMKEYFEENQIEMDTDSVGEELFADHLMDMHDFGKVLTEDEKLKLLLASE